MKRLIVILVISVCLNLVAVYLIIKYHYKQNHEVSFEMKASANPNRIVYNMNRQTIYALFTVNPDDIVFAGDSHTQKFDVQEFLPNYKIIDRGIDNDISAGLLNRLNQFTAGLPKKIFIEIGFNDLFYHIKPDSILKNLGLITNTIRIRSPKSLIYINTIFPCNKRVDNNLIDTANKLIKQFCIKKNISLIDIHKELVINNHLNPLYDCGDGVHLNGNGYVVWTKLLKQFL